MAKLQLSLKEKIWVVKQMYRLEYPVNVQRLWCKENNNNPPHRNTIRSLINKFEQTGSVLNSNPSGRPISITDQNTKDEVSSILEEEPQTSTRRMSVRMGISRSSVLSIYKSFGI